MKTSNIINIETAMTMMEEIVNAPKKRVDAFEMKKERAHNSKMTRLNVQAYIGRELEIKTLLSEGLKNEGWIGSEEHIGLSEAYSALTDLMFA